MIIDSHCHIYPEKIAQKASDSTAGFYNAPVKYDGTLSRLNALEADAGIEHFIVQSVAVTPSQAGGINRFIAKTVLEGGGKITGLGTLHPDSGTIGEDIRQIVALGLRGVKLHADMQQIAINDKRCYKIYEQLQGVLPVLLHAGDSRYGFSNPDNLVPVLKDFPGLTVIAAHFGGWSVWEEAMVKLPRYQNLYVDTSSTFGFMGSGYFKKCVKAFDPLRILFGSDYPMWEPKAEIEALRGLGLSQEDYDNISYKNAARLYGIPCPQA